MITQNLYIPKVNNYSHLVNRLIAVKPKLYKSTVYIYKLQIYMRDITSNEMLFVLSIFKNPEIDYNARSISKILGISHMGALKIAKRLEKENILISRQLGRAFFYKLNFNNDYAEYYAKFLLKREAEQSHYYVKRWVRELKKIKNASCIILFGSILRKYENARDIDVLFITEQKIFSKLQKEIDDVNLLNIKKIHPMFQTKEDIINNIKIRDKPLLNAIKGIIVYGEDILIELMEK